jgi:hypothetical protein
MKLAAIQVGAATVPQSEGLFERAPEINRKSGLRCSSVTSKSWYRPAGAVVRRLR